MDAAGQDPPQRQHGQARADTDLGSPGREGERDAGAHRHDQAAQELVHRWSFRRVMERGRRPVPSQAGHSPHASAPLQAEVEDLGLEWRQEMLELAEVPCPDWVATRYGIDQAAPVCVRRRRFWIDGTPSQLADSYYLLDLVKGTRIMMEENTGPGGGYRVLEELGYPLTRVREEVAPRIPTPDEVRALHLEPGTPVAELHRVSFSGATPIEALQGILAGDRYVFCYDMPVND